MATGMTRKQTALMKKYTTKRRTFKMSWDGRFITVYYLGSVYGFIWNNDKEIYMEDGPVVSSEFFK